MKFPRILLIFLLVQTRCSARDLFRTDFIYNFVLNEQKPTHVNFFDLCWRTGDEIILAHQLTHLGTRVSSRLHEDLKNFDNSLFLLDLDCPNSEQLLNLASSWKLFSQPHRWLVLTSSTNDSRLDTLWNCPLLPDSDLVLAKRTDDEFAMVELHKPSKSHTMVKTPRGFYNGTFMDTRPHREMYRRRSNLAGHTLTMANVIQDSNSTKDHLEDALELQYDVVAKISWLNAKQAFLMLNATPQYIFSYRWGYKVNGQWSGMINDLHSGNADIGTNCLMSDVERFTAVSYSDTLAPFDVRFVFRQPPLSYVSNIYSLPFSTNLWVGVAVCAVISSAAIAVAAKWEAKFGLSASQLSGSVNDAVFWTMAALSQQGCDMEPRRTPGRIMECVVFTSLMALYAAYSANIVVLLQAPSNSIKTLSQLASSKITLAANDVDYNHFVFKQFKDPVHVNIYKKIEPEGGKGKPQFYSIDEGVEKIRQGLFAFHSITEPVYRRIEETFQESEKCDLTEIDCLNSFQPYAPIAKGSPYEELIRVAFKRIIETGVGRAMNNRYQVRKPQCPHKATAFTSVGLTDLKPVLLLIIIGGGTSVAVLCVEIAVFRIISRKNLKTK